MFPSKLFLTVCVVNLRNTFNPFTSSASFPVRVTAEDLGALWLGEFSWAKNSTKSHNNVKNYCFHKLNSEYSTYDKILHTQTCTVLHCLKLFDISDSFHTILSKWKFFYNSYTSLNNQIALHNGSYNCILHISLMWQLPTHTCPETKT